MKLYPLHRQLAMPQAHDLIHVTVPGFGPGGDFQTVRQSLRCHHQAVVAGSLEGLAQAPKHTLPAVVDKGSLAVHHLPRAHPLPAVHLADALHAQAHPQYRQLAGILGNHRHGNAGLIGRAGPRGNDNALRRQRRDVGNGDFIVAHHLHFGPEFTQILHDIPGEGVVVVDHEYLEHKNLFTFNALMSTSTFS